MYKTIKFKPIKFKKSAIAAALLAAGVSGSAMADPKIEEIVVTAQFVKQNLQKTPIAITAISEESLAMRGHETVDDIAAQTPNVSLTQGGGYSGPSLVGFIRGVGQTDFNPALEAGVGLYVDDVYYSQLSGSVLDLLDLERVEVLRGPQGTLAGKNSIGGSIKLYTKRPEAEANGYLETGFGNMNTASLRAGSNFTLVADKLYARISGASRSNDGYVDRLDYNCSHPGAPLPGVPSTVNDGSCKTGEDGSSDYTAVRLALRLIASDNFEANFSIDKVKNKLGAPPSVLVGTYNIGDPVPSAHRAAWNTYRNLFVPAKGEYVTYGTYVDNRTNLRIPDGMHVESVSSALNLDWQLTDTLQLQSITGHRSFETSFGTDLDGSPFPLLQQFQKSTHKQLSEEIRLNGSVGDFMDYTVGAFYFKADTTLAGRIDLGYTGVNLDFIHGPDPVAVTNTAAFVNTIMHPMESIDVTLGARYSTDEKSYTYHRHNPNLSDIQPCNGSPVQPTTNSNCVLNGLNNLQPKPFEDTRMDYKAAVSWKVSDSGMLYYQYSTGFKGGGVNPRPFYAEQASPFKPETLATNEVGAKWQLFDDRMRLNAAYFKNKYKDIQLTLLNCTAYFGSAKGLPCLAPKNAGDADSSGFELEMDFKPVENWLIEASYSTLDFEYTKLDSFTGMTGKEVTPFTPKTTWSFSTQYDIHTSFGTFTPRIDTNYQDKVQTAAGITPYGTIDARTLYNMSLNYLSPTKDWLLRFEVRNAGDEYYYTNITDNASSGHAYALMGKPRTMNLSFKYMF